MNLNFADLIPVVVQDAATADVLMLGFMNEEAFQQTRSTGLVHFWSRSRNRLWLKGESSGHTLSVESIRVNCELNSLLILATPAGAVCHDGYPTCFYRQIEGDDTFTTIRDRSFDPEDVYGEGGIASVTREWWNGFLVLQQPEFADISGTARVLQAENDQVTERICDELEELAGVLDGTHAHRNPVDDVRLESGQTCYWVLLACLRANLTWEEVRPDLSLSNPVGTEGQLPILLRQLVERWRNAQQSDVVVCAQQSFSLMGAALRQHEIDAQSVIAEDLKNLTARINSYQAH